MYPPTHHTQREMRRWKWPHLVYEVKEGPFRGRGKQADVRTHRTRANHPHTEILPRLMLLLLQGRCCADVVAVFSSSSFFVSSLPNAHIQYTPTHSLTQGCYRVEREYHTRGKGLWYMRRGQSVQCAISHTSLSSISLSSKFQLPATLWSPWGWNTATSRTRQ